MPKRRLKIKIIFLMPCAIMSSCSPAGTIKVVNPFNVSGSILSAGNALISLSREDGRFLYSTVPLVGRPATAYNLVRHFGTLWALEQYRDTLDGTDTALSFAENTVERGMRFASPYLLKKRGAAYYQSLPTLESNQKPPRSLLGASALALLVRLNERGHFIADQADRALGLFLILLQKKNGEFYSSLEGRLEGNRRDFYSPYYSGESILALLSLFQKDQQPTRSRWLQAALRGLSFAINNDPVNSDQANNWTLLALAKLREASPREFRNLRNTYLNFIDRKIQAQIKQQVPIDGPAGWAGCYTLDENVTGTAARLEGMLAAYAILKEYRPSESLVAVGKSLRSAMGCVLSAQLRTGKFQGTFLIRTGPGYDQEKLEEIRIDTTQHALAALLRYREYGLGEPMLPSPGSANLRIPDADFRNARFRSEAFSKSNFESLNADSAQFQWVDFRSTTFRAASLRGTYFSECTFRKARFEAGDASAARFFRSDLRQSTFWYVNLSGTDFSFSDLSQAIFYHSDLRNALLLGANLEGAKYDYATQLPFSQQEAERKGMKLLP